MTIRDDQPSYLIAPDPARVGLTRAVSGSDQFGEVRDVSVVEERPLTIFLNSQEIVTAIRGCWWILPMLRRFSLMKRCRR